MRSCPSSSAPFARGRQCCLLATTHRPSCRSRCYPSDITDAQWALIEPLLPTPDWLAGRGGRGAKHCRREIVDAILYVVHIGLKWRASPADFPPWSTVYKHFASWEHQGAT
ncbi:transposase [Saccharopolyspora sp. NPDC049426]|uniref:transposase n=1 Tax=Saccharopolyspora sp. NPDC049426 TaxID=3155652 RepID=UPI00342C6D56